MTAPEMPEIVEELDVMVPMRDGIRLRTDVLRPAAPGVHPTLVQRYPYTTRDGIMRMLGRFIATQGYVVLVQSVRGRYGSEGEFYVLRDDVEDGYDTVEWAAAQPWSNGKVGMYGVSYSGMTSWSAAIARPPHLVAIAPMSSSWSFFGSSAWYLAPGVLALGMGVSWSGGATVWEAEKRGLPAPVAAFAEAERIMAEVPFTDPEARRAMPRLQREGAAPLLGRRPLRDIEELAQLAPWFRDILDYPDPTDPYWTRISAKDHVEDLDLPVLNLVGWYDFFTKGAIDAFAALRSKGVTEQARAGQRLVVGPWNHMSFVPRPDADPQVEPIFTPDSASPMMRFFAHHLKGEHPDYLAEAPVRLYVMGENRWRDESEWPLARTRWTSYFLDSITAANTLDGDGTLSTEPSAEGRVDTFVYDPSDPVPGSYALGAALDDPVDPNEVGRRPDVLVYTTPPLSEDLEVTGPVTLELWASSSAPSTDFTAKLIDVFPDGQAVPLCQGVVRTDAALGRPAVPGAVYRFEIDLWATSNLFQAGHRIRLDISSSEFPLYDPNPNTGERITTDGSGKTVPATQRIFHDAHHPSHLVLPVIPR